MVYSSTQVPGFLSFTGTHVEFAQHFMATWGAEIKATMPVVASPEILALRAKVASVASTCDISADAHKCANAAAESHRLRVLAGITERAIKLASEKVYTGTLFQWRVGRAIYALGDKVLQYARRWGITFATRVVKDVEWVPICGSQKVSGPLDRISTIVGKVLTPLESLSATSQKVDSVGLVSQQVDVLSNIHSAVNSNTAVEHTVNVQVSILSDGYSEENSNTSVVEIPPPHSYILQYSCDDGIGDIPISGWACVNAIPASSLCNTQRGNENYSSLLGFEPCAPWFVTTEEHTALEQAIIALVQSEQDSLASEIEACGWDAAPKSKSRTSEKKDKYIRPVMALNIFQSLPKEEIPVVKQEVCILANVQPERVSNISIAHSALEVPTTLSVDSSELVSQICDDQILHQAPLCLKFEKVITTLTVDSSELVSQICDDQILHQAPPCLKFEGVTTTLTVDSSELVSQICDDQILHQVVPTLKETVSTTVIVDGIAPVWQNLKPFVSNSDLYLKRTNGSLPTMPRVLMSAKEMRDGETCKSALHECLAHRDIWTERFYLSQCLYCAFDALQQWGIEEAQLKAWRVADFNSQFEKLPAAEIEKAGVSKSSLFGGLFDASTRHNVWCEYVHAVDYVQWRASQAKKLLMDRNPNDITYCHSEREDGETSAKLQDKAEEDHDKYWSSVESVKDKLKRKKGKKVPNSGEGMLGDKKTKLVEKDVFTKVVHGGHFDKLRHKFTSDGSMILTEQTFPLRDEEIRIGTTKDCPIYTRLPTFTEAELRRLLDKNAMSNTGVVALDMAIQSHVPEGTPMVAFSTIMDGRTDDPHVAAQCGAYCDLGRGRCQILSLPLVNFNLNELSKRLGNDDPELYLATYFNDTLGYRPGELVCTYGSSELLEHKPDAYTNKSLCKDTWDDILKRNVQKGNRIVKGFNVIDSISQDYDQEVPDFGEVSFKTKPRSGVAPTKAFTAKGVVEVPNERKLTRTFSLARTQFGRAPTRNPSQFGGLANVSTSHVDYTGSNREHNSFIAPRHSTAQSELENPFVVATTSVFKVAKDAKEGTFIGTIDFYDLVAKQHKSPYQQWLGSGLVDPEIQIKIFSGANAFMGTTVAIVHDFYNRLDIATKLGGRLPRLVGNCMPQTLHPLSEGGVTIDTVNISRYLGHSLYISAKGFADPRFHVYIYDDNAVEAAEGWRLTVEILVRKATNTTEEVVDNALLTVPMAPSSFIELDIYKGFGSIALADEPLFVPIGMNFASEVTYATGKTCLGFTQAKYRVYQGAGGRLQGRLRRVGTTLTSCILRLVMWWGSTYPTLEETSAIPHVDMDLAKVDGSFDLEIRSPYGRVPNREMQGYLVIYPIGGPISPSGSTAPFNFSVYIGGIQATQQIPTLLLPDKEYVWCQLDAFNPGVVTFDLPNHICDFTVVGAAVHLRSNPLSAIFGSCGFFKGSLSITLEWTQEGKLPDKGSVVWIAHKYGTPADSEILDSCTSNSYLPGKCTFLLHTGDYTNANKPGGSGNKLQFITVWLGEASAVDNIRVSVRLMPGFSFYGRSISFPT
ncbi:polyprotein [Potato virus U]|uniref:Polyprotein n=1 Tax=Potato virus U TaxID=2170039 RepID=A0A494RIB2_9SECO|nr:polyprotein [Potato virus U]AYF57454.1 polyprotein [Potato virus U]